MGFIALRLLPFLLLVLAVFLILTLKKQNKLNTKLLSILLAVLAISIIGGGLTLFFMDKSPSQPHTYTPTQYIDGKIVRGHPE